MDKSNIIRLVKEAEVIPKLEYDNDLMCLKANTLKTIKAVRRRLGVLEELIGEIEFELTLNHMDDEEYE